MATARIYLTGPVVIEHGRGVVGERGLPGRQGRLAFVYLTVSRHGAVARDDLTRAIWNDEPPAQADAALDAILSKLRALFRTCGWTPAEAGIDVHSGSIRLRLPSDAWVDLEAATNALDEAEGAVRRNDVRSAWSQANVVVAIARRPFVADTEAPWIEAQRAALRKMLARALQCLATASAASGDPVAAVQYAVELVELEPFRETGYQQLMRMHAAAGDRAEALRVFARCRKLLREELGVSPSPQTEAVFLEILRTTS